MALNDIKVPKENAQGTFDEVTLTPAQIGAVATSAVGTAASKNTPATGNASSSEVVLGNDTRLSDSRTPSSTLAHKASHSTGGTDALAPSDIGAQSIFTVEDLTITSSSQINLTAARAKIFDIVQFAGTNVNIQLPSTGAMQGDVFVFRWGTGSSSVTILNSISGAPIGTVSNGEQKRFIRSATDNWTSVPVDTHTHAASAITSGTIDVARLPVGTGSTQVAAGNHTHVVADVTGAAASGSITSSGLTQATARLIGRTSSGVGAPEELSASDVRTFLNVADGAEVNVNADWNSSSGDSQILNKPTLGSAAAAATTDFATAAQGTKADSAVQPTIVDAKGDLLVGSAADTLARLPVGATNGHVLTVDSSEATGVKWAAASGGVSGVDSTTADVFSVSGSNLVADSSAQIDSADPFVKYDTAGTKLVYANPLSRPSGAMYVGLAPTTTALGSDSVNVQSARSAATRVASGSNAVNIGSQSTASGNNSVAIGSVANQATGTQAVAIGYARATNTQAVAIGGDNVTASAGQSVSIGVCGSDGGSTAVYGVSLNTGGNNNATLRGQLSTRPFSSVYWGGSTTDATANVELNLDATATNRMTIAANTMVIADIMIGGNSTAGGKASFWHYHVAIRRDGSNNTSLVGAVEQIGTTQAFGSPSGWGVTIDNDDTNESLRVRVTGEASTTITWRAVAFYRVI